MLKCGLMLLNAVENDEHEDDDNDDESHEKPRRWEDKMKRNETKHWKCDEKGAEFVLMYSCTHDHSRN